MDDKQENLHEGQITELSDNHYDIADEELLFNNFSVFLSSKNLLVTIFPEN